MKRIPTTERLAKVLEQLEDPKLADMIKRAREGYYDPYKSTIGGGFTPLIELIKDLDAAGYPEVAERARNGEWEAKYWEADEWFEKEGRNLIRRHWPGKRRGADTI